MPKYYHGTSRAHALAMCGQSGKIGTIDVSQGGGEFGRGFYTQSSLANAHRRGYLIHGQSNGAILILDIGDGDYHALRFWRLSLNQVQQLNARLRGPARTNYVTAHDVIVGPLVSSPRVEQQKFQSAAAQNLLNGPQTQRTVA